VMATLEWPMFGPVDAARAIDIMPDGQGYVVLDLYGRVFKYGSATTGLVGTASTPEFNGDAGRDIKIIWAWGTLGYYVLDDFGGVHAGGQLAAKSNPNFSLWADRWRSLTVVDGRLLLLKNDGSTTFANG
jgi:hypothetical protein